MAELEDQDDIIMALSDEEEIVVMSPRRLKRKAPGIELHDDSDADEDRPAPKWQSDRIPLKQLSSPQFQRKIRGPIAWVSAGCVKRQKVEETTTKAKHEKEEPPVAWVSPVGIKRQNLDKRPHTGAKERCASSNGKKGIRSFFMPLNKDISIPIANADTTATASGRPKRAAVVRSAFDALMAKTSLVDVDSSEDDIIAKGKPARAGRKISVKTSMKARNRRDSDGSTFEDDGADVSSDPISDAAVSDDDSGDSASEAGISDIDSIVDMKPSKPTKKSQTAHASRLDAKTGGTGKTGKSRGGGKAEVISLISARGKNLPKGLVLSLPPLSDPYDIFEHMTQKALALGFDKTVQRLKRQRIRVATMCSGTESPLLALEMIQCALKDFGIEHFEIDHLFSAEIVEFKQAFIQRNFAPPIIFRDITELTGVVDDPEPMATTAFGGKVAVPRDVDVVIAGTSCVDFSNLNNRKKGIKDDGESADTWQAVLSYCRVYRPKIVLLENVRHAAWDTMLSDYRKIGYECCSVAVDTKDYYLPQTRQRGYMVCFNAETMGKAKAEKAVKQWISVMTELKRPCSTPVSSFLLPSDEIAHRQIRTEETSREVDWSQCEVTQNEYRQEKKLGNGRPFTHWSVSGWINPPDNGYAPWFKAQVERVKDTLDAALLRKSRPENGMYDTRYKTRILDLSQNVYMYEDTGQLGIMGCLTPTGQFFLTDSCRALDARELLSLQGFPLDKMSFTTESGRNIQDLAGNAMSTSVIGAAILAALTAGESFLESHDNESNTATSGKPLLAQPALEFTEGPLTTRTLALGKTSDVDVSELLAKAERTLRKCYCEGASGMTATDLQQCEDCDHTTCVSCGGNPRHNYQRVHGANVRRSLPKEFEDYVRGKLPLQLRLSLQNLQTSSLPQKYSKVVQDVISSCFNFTYLRRTHCWTVTYAASDARLELVLEAGRMHWELFAKLDKGVASDAPLAKLLKQPILKSSAKEGFEGQDWILRIPDEQKVVVEISGSGRTMASWFARNGLPDARNHHVWEYLDVKVDGSRVDKLQGRYQYLSHCDTACGGLYKKVEHDGLPIYFFLDPDRVGAPELDCYVFSHNKALLEVGEIRPILARVTPGWVPWSKSIQEAKSKTTVPWKQTPPNWKISLILDDRYSNVKGRLESVEATVTVRSIEKAAAVVDNTDCSRVSVILSCTIPGSAIPDLNGDKVIIKASDRTFFEKHAWVFHAMRRDLPDEHWQVLDVAHVSCPCERCAPARATLSYRISNGDVEPYEDPVAAAAYERLVKSRPETMVVGVHSNSHRTRLDLGVNIASLAHRAGSRLPSGLNNVTYEWRFTLRSANQSFKFKPFQLSATRGVKPYAKDLDMTIQLFPKQLQALSWMQLQERGVTFTLEEVEETSIPSLGWYPEARARGDVKVRGGICADHPGFGKTITSLALVQAQLAEATKDEIIADIAQRYDGDLHITAATLIVCPASLLQQWTEEIKDKTGSNSGVIAVNSTATLNNLTIADIMKARIVLVNRSVLASEGYIERLAVFAAMPEPAVNSGRSLIAWREYASKRIPDHLQVLERRGTSELKKHIQVTYQGTLEDEQFTYQVPSRRLRGRNYVAAKSKKSEHTKPALKTIDVTNVHRPLLEMFYWNRLIVDEFHQYAPAEYSAIVALKADKRWGLSGTPAFGDFYESAQMAKLLDVPLRVGSDAKGIMKGKSVDKMRKDMTPAERFNAWRQQPSDTMHGDIHKHHQKFLDTFVRRNIMDFAEIKVTNHLVPVTLEPDHYAMYMEVSQQCNSLDMRIRKGKRDQATDREARFVDASKSSATAEELLSKTAAFYDRSNSASINTLIKTREQELQKLGQRLPAAIATTRVAEPERFAKWLSKAEDGNYEDDETTEEIMKAVKSTKGKVAKDFETFVDSDEEVGKKKSTRSTSKAAGLNKLCKRLLTSRRSLRYLQNIRDLMDRARSRSTEGLKCNDPDCANDMQANGFAVSAFCGHVICRSCHGRRKGQAQGRCYADGCLSELQDYHLLWTEKMGDLKRSVTSPYGVELATVTNLLTEIKAKREQAILFVQFEEQLDECEAALTAENISGTVVKSAGAAGAQLAEFRESATSKNPTTVIVLNASDETAAGSNLQNANHVIFLSPLLRDTQYGYDSTMAQAIGRVRRHGQKRAIHIYRIVALNTIDVDILEHHERRIDSLVERGCPAVKPPDVPTVLDAHGEPLAERTQLVKEGGRFSLCPHSWLIRDGVNGDPSELQRVKGKSKVLGWEDFSSSVKFTKAYTEDDEWS